MIFHDSASGYRFFKVRQCLFIIPLHGITHTEITVGKSKFRIDINRLFELFHCCWQFSLAHIDHAEIVETFERAR